MRQKSPEALIETEARVEVEDTEAWLENLEVTQAAMVCLEENWLAWMMERNVRKWAAISLE